MKEKFTTKNQITLILQLNDQNISNILEIIENNREIYGIEDYIISSTSLEDVFLKNNSNIFYQKKDNKENENINNPNDINTNSLVDNEFLINNNEIYLFKNMEIGRTELFISRLLNTFTQTFFWFLEIKILSFY